MQSGPPPVPREDYAWEVGQELCYDESLPDPLHMPLDTLRKSIQRQYSSAPQYVNKYKEQDLMLHTAKDIDNTVTPHIQVLHRQAMEYGIEAMSSLGKAHKVTTFNDVKLFDKECRKMFPNINIDKIPRKAVFALGSSGAEVKRKAIEHYIRTICQISEIRPFLGNFLDIEVSALYEIGQYYKNNPTDLLSKLNIKKSIHQPKEEENVISPSVYVEKKRSSLIGVRDKSLLEPKQFSQPSSLLEDPQDFEKD
jgi:hypothetical protein